MCTRDSAGCLTAMNGWTDRTGGSCCCQLPACEVCPVSAAVSAAAGMISKPEHTAAFWLLHLCVAGAHACFDCRHAVVCTCSVAGHLALWISAWFAGLHTSLYIT